jgi:hypothetical protein
VDGRRSSPATTKNRSTISCVKTKIDLLLLPFSGSSPRPPAARKGRARGNATTAFEAQCNMGTDFLFGFTIIPRAALSDSRRGVPRGEISNCVGAGDSRHAISGEIAGRRFGGRASHALSPLEGRQPEPSSSLVGCGSRWNGPGGGAKIGATGRRHLSHGPGQPPRSSQTQPTVPLTGAPLDLPFGCR